MVYLYMTIIFKHLFLLNHLANQSQFNVGRWNQGTCCIVINQIKLLSNDQIDRRCMYLKKIAHGGSFSMHPIYFIPKWMPDGSKDTSEIR